jgi:hypothetical protein
MFGKRVGPLLLPRLTTAMLALATVPIRRMPYKPCG